jgi:hypothetical protein
MSDATQRPKDALSSTPRTNAAARYLRDSAGEWVDTVTTDFARQLERELNEAKSLNETLKRSNLRLRQQVKP